MFSRIGALENLWRPEPVEKSTIQAEFVIRKKLLERTLLMSCEQVNPRPGECLVIDVLDAMVPREAPDALSDNFHGLMKWVVVMEGEPSESKMISVAKHREW
jgi:hypothetical protein